MPGLDAKEGYTNVVIAIAIAAVMQENLRRTSMGWPNVRMKRSS
jgi:hypothetical protein